MLKSFPRVESSIVENVGKHGFLSHTSHILKSLQPAVGSGCRAGQRVCSGPHPRPQKGPLPVQAVRAVERVGGRIACWLRAEGEDTPVGRTLGSQREQ